MQNFYNEDMVQRYAQMIQEEHDPNPIVLDTLCNKLKKESLLLELGSGAGADYEVLSRKYQVIGSDYSEPFLRYLEERFGRSFLHLDASQFRLEMTVAAIYSNKVLHHLSPELLQSSFKSQYEALDSDGFALHTFWYGEGYENFHGMDVYQYSEKTIEKLSGSYFRIEDFLRYREFEDDDSMLLVLRTIL